MALRDFLNGISVSRTNPFENGPRISRINYDYDGTNSDKYDDDPDYFDKADLVKQRSLLDYNPLDDINRIKRYHIRSPEEGYADRIGHVIFVKPELNLMNGSALNKEADRDHFIHELFGDVVGKQIILSLSENSIYTSPFLPLLGSRARSFTPVESTLKTSEIGENWIGEKIVIAADNSGETSGGTISIPMIDCVNQMGYKTIKVWKEYPEKLKRGELSRSKANIFHNKLDYGGAIYYIVTRNDGQILNWWKFYGVFPLNLPADPYAYSVGDSSVPELNINYQYSTVSKSMNMVVLGELKQLADSYVAGSKDTPDYDTDNDMLGDVYVDAPLIMRDPTTRKLYLKWKSKE